MLNPGDKVRVTNYRPDDGWEGVIGTVIECNSSFGCEFVHVRAGEKIGLFYVSELEKIE